MSARSLWGSLVPTLLTLGLVGGTIAGCAPPSTALPPNTALPPTSGGAPASSASGPAGSVLSDAAARGHSLFTTAGPMGTGCLPCHGPDGQGGNGIPANAGATADMIKAAFQGEPMKTLFGTLTDQQISDLAAYLATLH